MQALVATLHIGGRVPLRGICRLLREMCGLRISAGEVVELLDGAKAAGKQALRELREQVRSSPAVCADACPARETGWRQDGENG